MVIFAEVMNCRVTIPENINCRVQLPPSKSIAVRAMFINALAGNSPSVFEKELAMSSISDIDVMAHALASESDYINVRGAGTAMRFLTAFFAIQEGRTVVLDGDKRMRQRPIGVLVDTLRQMGADINYLDCEGFPPLKITGRKLQGSDLHIDGSVSSQYISALLMIAPVVGGMKLTIDGDIVSRPYIDMTLELMRHYGIEACYNSPSKIEGVRGSMTSHNCDLKITVPESQYFVAPLAIEGDWSAASYWFALKALLPESKIMLSPLNENSLQGDRAITEMMKPLGVNAKFSEDGVVTLTSTWTDEVGLVHTLPRYYERDMSDTPDLVPTLVATLCLLHVPFRLTGLQSLRIKESDRVEALRVELAKFGYLVECDHSTMRYDGNHSTPPPQVLIDPHGDHRIAMALSLAATLHPGITIKDAEVVQKSYPQWWQHLNNTQCSPKIC